MKYKYAYTITPSTKAIFMYSCFGYIILEILLVRNKMMLSALSTRRLIRIQNVVHNFEGVCYHKAEVVNSNEIVNSQEGVLAPVKRFIRTPVLLCHPWLYKRNGLFLYCPR